MENINNSTQSKLGFRRKFGYSIGQMTDSIGFNVFYFFFLFFLTDFAGVNPAAAGTISLIAVIWDAVTDPCVGYISDNLKSKAGRRRPLMIRAIIPYGICTFLLFNNVDLGANTKFVYFVALAILFWSCYKTFVIPFFALGAELTDDYNERTSLRVWASVLLYIAVLLASAAPPTILSISERYGQTGTQGWNNIGIIFGLLIILTGFICWMSTKGGELKDKNPELLKSELAQNKENIIENFLSVLKLKPTKWLAGSVLFWAIVSAFSSSGPVYLMEKNLGYPGELQSTYFTIMSLGSIAWLPLVSFLTSKLDKRSVYWGAMLISAVNYLVFSVVGFGSFAHMVVYVLIFAFGNTTFWTVYYSMMYDISELDELINDKRREGSISAMMSFFQKLGSALCMWMIGFFLELSGYIGEAAVQADSAKAMIVSINTLIPGIFGLLAVACAFFYPITGKRFDALTNALKIKRQGGKFTSEGFERLI